jgi:hypothetical protein
MKKKFFTVLLAGALIVALSAAVFAGAPIRIFYNGAEVRTDVSPVNISGSIFAPVRAVAEAMGAKVTWDKESNQVNITGNDQSVQIANLERALAPKGSLDAVNSWAEAVQMRNGAWQYAVMTPELKKRSYDELASMGWSTGTSSPWVKSFEVKELGGTEGSLYRYSVTFTWTDSTNATSETTQYVTVKNSEGTWLVDSIDTLSVKGEITKINVRDDGAVESVFIESGADTEAMYSEALAIIGEDTKIYQGYTDSELKPEDLKTGSRVEVFFGSDPMIMIYPPQAMAKVIRVF